MNVRITKNKYMHYFFPDPWGIAMKKHFPKV